MLLMWTLTSPYSRQSTTDKATSALKPDSAKSGTEQLGDKAKGAGDSLAGKAQPGMQIFFLWQHDRFSHNNMGKSLTRLNTEDEKSTFQQAQDGVSNLAGQAKDAVTGGSQSGQDHLGLGDSKSSERIRCLVKQWLLTVL